MARASLVVAGVAHQLQRLSSASRQRTDDADPRRNIAGTAGLVFERIGVSAEVLLVLDVVGLLVLMRSATGLPDGLAGPDTKPVHSTSHHRQTHGTNAD